MSQRVRSTAVAAYLGLSTSTLAKMRLRGDGPLYSKINGRAVIYDLRDVDAWLDACKRRSTSEARQSFVEGGQNATADDPKGNRCK